MHLLLKQLSKPRRNCARRGLAGCPMLARSLVTVTGDGIICIVCSGGSCWCRPSCSKAQGLAEEPLHADSRDAARRHTRQQLGSRILQRLWRFYWPLVFRRGPSLCLWASNALICLCSAWPCRGSRANSARYASSARTNWPLCRCANAVPSSCAGETRRSFGRVNMAARLRLGHTPLLHTSRGNRVLANDAETCVTATLPNGLLHLDELSHSGAKL